MKNTASPPVTVLTITTSLLILHFVTTWDWPIIVSLTMGMASVIIPALAMKIDCFWKAFTNIISLVLRHSILTLIYYLFLFPIAIASKVMSGRDPLRLSNNSSTTFVDINKSFEKKDFEKQW